MTKEQVVGWAGLAWMFSLALWWVFNMFAWRLKEDTRRSSNPTETRAVS